MRRLTETEGDPAARANAVAWTMSGAQMPPERRKAREKREAVGGGFPLVGTADVIAALSDAGVDGLCLTWVNYERGLPQFIGEILPRLQKQGLRLATS